MGIINIVLGIWDSRSSRWHHRRNRSACSVSCFTAIRGFILWVLTPVFFVLDHPLAACRFGFRCLCKSIARRKKSRDVYYHKSSSTADNALHKKEFNMTDRPPILPYEILLMIARDVHHVDLLNAGRASKKLRMTLFGTEGPLHWQLEDLRPYTCQGTNKTNCDICQNIQTCPVSPPKSLLLGYYQIVADFILGL
jgi:hypothetical protein